MSKRTSNYNNSKIFKIVNNINGECFYNCTVEPLKSKFNNYKNLYNNWLIKTQRANTPNNFNLFKLRETANIILYNNLFNVYGINNCSIILVELYPCNNILELKNRLNYYINKYTCINTTNNYLLENKEEEEDIYLDAATDDDTADTASIASNTTTAWSYINLNTMD